MNSELPPQGVSPARWPVQTRVESTDRFSQAARLHGQFARYLGALRKRWWVFAVPLLFIGSPAVYLALIRPPAYQSQAVMWVTGQLRLPSEGLYAEELSSYIGTQAQLIKSSLIQSRAWAKVRAQFPELAAAGSAGGSVALPFDLSIRSSTKSSVLELRATGLAKEPTRAFLDAIMEEYLAFKKDSRQRTSTGALSSITDQVGEVESQIQRQQNEITLFQVSNNISFLSEHGLSAGSHLARLAELLSDLRTEHRLLELLTPAEFKGLSEAPRNSTSETSLPGERSAQALALNSGAPQSAYYQAMQQLQILKSKRDEFGQMLRPTHSKMVKMNQEIAGLEQLLQALHDEGEQQAQAHMQNRKKSLELQIQNLESQYGDWETNAAQASRKLAFYDRMKQDLQRSQALYDRLLSLLQTVDLNHNLDQEPLVPLAPASAAKPTLSKYSIGAAGLFLAMLLGTGAFIGLESLDDRFTSVRELSLHVPAEVVAQIPRARLHSRGGAGHLPTDPNGQPAFAEAFRNLRSSLLFMTGQNPHPRTILITSSVPKEGKSTVAANLAAALASSGSSVLLVDADFRRGSVHRIFQVGLKPGLLEVLCQGMPSEEAIVATADPNLCILPAGEAGDCSSDVFLRHRMDLLVQKLSRRFSHVIIDSAPVLATDDAACVGPATDGVFLVVRAAHTSSRLIREALDRLQKRSVKVLGIVYNGAAPSMDYYCQYGRDYYQPRQVKGTSAPRPTSVLSQPESGRKPTAQIAPELRA